MLTYSLYFLYVKLNYLYIFINNNYFNRVLNVIIRSEFFVRKDFYLKKKFISKIKFISKFELN